MKLALKSDHRAGVSRYGSIPGKGLGMGNLPTGRAMLQAASVACF
jgi:hypothetical protein